MKLKHPAWLWPAALAALALACSSDATGPITVSPDALNIVRLPAGTTFDFDSASFYVKRGNGGQGVIFFRGEHGDFLRLKLGPNAIQTRPDGTPLLPGDSILITLSVPDSTRFLFEFGPAGLVFSPSAPPQLTVHYAATKGDLNGDGVVNDVDRQLQGQLAVWHQAVPGGDFVRLTSTVDGADSTVQAAVPSFSRFAIAY